MTRLPWRRSAVVVAAAAMAIQLGAPPSMAVPSFARRYGASCQTCHVVFPKLTPFGEAFRRNAYQFPDGQDEDYRRQEPMKLGADGYRDVFPWSVWPGEIPPMPPMSAVLTTQALGNPSATDPKAKLAFSGNIRVNAATNLGEFLSVWAGATASADNTGATQVAMERLFVFVSPGRGPWGNVRLGMFEPQLFSFTSHRTLGPMPWILSTKVGDNAFTLEPAQWGAEWSGVAPGGRGSFAVGIVDGAGNQVGPPTDIYARVSAKLGGLRLDGVASDASSSASPWREWSVLVGAFAYGGLSNVGDPLTASQDDRFIIVGGDVNAQLRDANVVVAYSFERHNRALIATPFTMLDTHHLMAQVDYNIFPWLVPSIRLERKITAGVAADRLSSSLYVLLRSNVRGLLQATAERAADRDVLFNRLLLGITAGF